jgi:ABC-type multidrug transport system fused ATPase/permease subunit
MSEKEKKRIITPSITKRIIRVFLRQIPLIPVPELYDLIEDLKRSQTSIDEKIRKAYDSLQETSGLIGELEGSLKEKTEKLTFLHQEYERYSKLAEVEEDNARALIQQIELSLGKGRKRERWISLVINLITGIIIFILGILLSPIIRTWLGIGG